MAKENEEISTMSLENIVTASVQIPGVKVNRKQFLGEAFAAMETDLQKVIDEGPVAAGVDRETLARMASKLILRRTSESSMISFATGIPGGLAMAATVPADVLQFFGMAFRLAQELSYLYGAEDLWVNGEIDNEKVRNQLILYCGVMFGVSGAAAGVRVLSAQVAKTALKKIPQKALTKTFWYPLLKQIGKAIGVKITKSTVAKGVSKAIPVVGGVISGSLNFASMMPMAKRLQSTLDSANFGYTDEDLNADCIEIETADFEQDKTKEETAVKVSAVKEKLAQGTKNIGSNLSGLFGGKTKERAKSNAVAQPAQPPEDDVFASIEKLAHLRDIGAITPEDFNKKKDELLSRL